MGTKTRRVSKKIMEIKVLTSSWINVSKNQWFTQEITSVISYTLYVQLCVCSLVTPLIQDEANTECWLSSTVRAATEITHLRYPKLVVTRLRDRQIHLLHGKKNAHHLGVRAYLVGGFNPFKKFLSKWESSPNRGENKRYLKPPPRSPPRYRQ